MKSFDFYDTLFVRLVAAPDAIFDIVERVSGIPDFAKMRRRAEAEATRSLAGREITLEEIYARIDLGACTRKHAMEIELRLEEGLVVPVAENMSRLQAGDVVLSDMYLPRQCLDSILRRHCAHAGVSLMVSSEHGSRKLDGSLWRKLAGERVQIERHVGDNWNADVRQPRAQGFIAEHYTGARLNRFERTYLKCGTDGNLIAGISRAARLSDEADESSVPAPLSRAIREVFCPVIAPVLVSFVEFVIDDCVHRGIRAIVFLARDGQVLYRIAKRLIAARCLPLEARYAHASRQSLHLPGYDEPTAAEQWLLEDTDELTTQIISQRAEVPEEIVLRACRDSGLAYVRANVPRSARDKLRIALRQPQFIDAVRSASAKRWPAAYEYLREMGFRAGAKIAIVDVGWSGRIQTSLRSVLRKTSEAPSKIVGYYLCLGRKPILADADELSGFLFDRDVQRGHCFLDPYRPVIEASLLADHGTTLSYEFQRGEAVPILASPPSNELIGLARAQQRAVMKFLDLVLRCEEETGLRIRWPKEVVVRNLRAMLQWPGKKEAVAFLSHRLAIEQGEQEEIPLVKSNLGVPDLLRRTSAGLWPEGSVVASGYRGLLPALAAARMVRRAILAGARD